MAWINSKALPVKLTNDLARLLGLAAKRGYSNEALLALALSVAASQTRQKRQSQKRQRKAVRRHA